MRWLIVTLLLSGCSYDWNTGYDNGTYYCNRVTTYLGFYKLETPVFKSGDIVTMKVKCIKDVLEH